MTEREVESRCAECGSRNRIRMLPRDPAKDVPGVLCLECSDFVPDQARADIRAEVLAEVVDKLETEKRRVQSLIDESDDGSGYQRLLRGEESGLLGAIATVREMGEK